MTGISCIMAGGAPVVVAVLVNGDVESTGSTSQTASYRISSDRGIYHTTTPSGTVKQYDWIPASGVPSDYEARATLLSGSVSGSATGTWLPLSSDRTWTVSDPTSGDGMNFANLTMEIRRGLTVQASASVIISAERI